MDTYQVFGYGKDGKVWCNTHQADTVVVEGGNLLFACKRPEKGLAGGPVLEHGYAAGAWAEFKRVEGVPPLVFPDSAERHIPSPWQGWDKGDELPEASE